ncbi:MAG: peptidoglycan DD-metalloendopeptidase family protein, partial [Aestuariivirgaceae bacterium]
CTVPGYRAMSSVSSTAFFSFKRMIFVSVAAILLSACSSDFQRFSAYPGVEKTASLPSKSASAGKVTSRRLDGGQPSYVKPSWQTGYSNGARKAPAIRTVSNQPTAGTSGTIVVQRGQTLYSIARANGMTPNRLATSNNMSAPYTLRVGQRLVLPGISNPVSPAPSFEPQSIVAANAPGSQKNYRASGMHRVSAGETLFAIGRTYQIHPYKIAAHNNLAKPYSLSIGQRLRIPGKNSVTAWQGTSATAPSAAEPVRQPSYANNAKTYKSSVPTIERAQPVETVEAPPVAKSQESLVGNRDNGRFRWPVRGRVISRYGSKPGGARNEGINISVPEGTNVRASEAGVVAYAGNELKGYGNLVLVRHEGGWVTAYAHNRDLLVQRGDTVRRGEVIAKAGQTGSVTSPQLHFEIRKGASAVNPLKHMSSTTASN